jgi:hypothetical protein
MSFDIKSFVKKNKYFVIYLCVVIVLIPTVYFCFIFIGVGKARINFKFNENFKKLGIYSYQVRTAEIGTEINFRKFVKTNNKTKWVLSSSINGSNPIETFTIRLNVGNNTYYVVCYDRIGISKTYRVNFQVNYRMHLRYYTEWNSNYLAWGFKDDLTNIWDIQSTSGFQYYREVIGEENYIEEPPPPTKDGKTFKGWTEAYYRKQGNLQGGYTRTKCVETIGNTIYKIYEAWWI